MNRVSVTQEGTIMPRQNVSSGTKWEAQVGYSRAVRIGNMISVSGTTAADEHSQCVGVGDPYAQAIYILHKIERALKEVGASMTDVIRTRTYVVRKEDWEAVGRAHGEIFGNIRPVSTMVQANLVVEPEFLVEIEVDAVVEG